MLGQSAALGTYQGIGGDNLLQPGGGFWNAPPQRPPGYYFEEVMRLGREAIGIGSSTMALYIGSLRWGMKSKGLRSHAMIMAKAMDMHSTAQDLRAWDLIATRLAALCHVNKTGSWETAEALQTADGRDTGLSTAVSLYRAQKEAKLMGRTSKGGPLSGSSDEGDGGARPQRKKWRARGKKEEPKTKA